MRCLLYPYNIDLLISLLDVAYGAIIQQGVLQWQVLLICRLSMISQGDTKSEYVHISDARSHACPKR